MKNSHQELPAIRRSFGELPTIEDIVNNLKGNLLGGGKRKYPNLDRGIQKLQLQPFVDFLVANRKFTYTEYLAFYKNFAAYIDQRNPQDYNLIHMLTDFQYTLDNTVLLGISGLPELPTKYKYISQISNIETLKNALNNLETAYINFVSKSGYFRDTVMEYRWVHCLFGSQMLNALLRAYAGNLTTTINMARVFQLNNGGLMRCVIPSHATSKVYFSNSSTGVDITQKQIGLQLPWFSLFQDNKPDSNGLLRLRYMRESQRLTSRVFFGNDIENLDIWHSKVLL